MLYVFVCKSSACVNNAGGNFANPNDPAKNPKKAPSVVILRAQLPQENKYYPSEGKVIIDPSKNPSPELCTMCGCYAPHRCAKCKGPRYCSRAHQLAHWKNGHSRLCATNTNSGIASKTFSAAVTSGCIFPEWEAEIVEELGAEERNEVAESKLPKEAAKALKQARKAMLQGSSTEETKEKTEGEEDLSIHDLTQKQLEEATGAKVFADAYLLNFQARCASDPGQVIRYNKWIHTLSKGTAGSPFIFDSPKTIEASTDKPVEKCASVAPTNCEQSENKDSEAAESPQEAKNNDEEKKDELMEEEEDDALHEDTYAAPLLYTNTAIPYRSEIPKCEQCGCDRDFEFQLMPQLLSYVLPDGEASITASKSAGVDLDYGTILVYTCTNSCVPKVVSEKAINYVQEFAWVQPTEEQMSDEQKALLKKRLDEVAEFDKKAEEEAKQKEEQLLQLKKKNKK